MTILESNPYKHIIKLASTVLLLALGLFSETSASALGSLYQELGDTTSLFESNQIIFWDPDICANEGNRQNASIYTGGEAEISGTTAKEKIWSGLKSLGLTDEVAAGTLGNMMHESGLSPARYENKWRSVWENGFDWETDSTGGHGVGLIQWSGGRRVNFFKYMREKNNDLTEKYLKKPSEYGSLSGDSFIEKANNEDEIDALYSLEITFLIDEIKNNSAYSGLFNQTTVDDAAVYFSSKIEGCTECLNPDSTTSKERRASAQEIFTEFSGKDKFNSGGGSAAKYSGINPACDCDDSGNIGGGLYAGAKYSFNNDELKRLWWAASAEQGTKEGRKAELSIFANVYETGGGTPGDNAGLIDKVTHRYHYGSGWFASSTGQAYETGCSPWECYVDPPNPEEIAIAKDILNNGNRVLPPEVDEHDSISDISSVSNNGASFDPGDKAQYKSGVTIIHNRMGSTYTFFQWANGNKECLTDYGSCGDPFGYTGEAPSGATSKPSVSGGNGPAASSLANNTKITWTEDGWVQGGIDGFVKEPAEGNISNLDSASGQDFDTEAINGGGKGPNKILLHSTEGPNGSGTSGLEFFEAGFVPHFTIDLKNKRLYQHFPLNKTSGAIKSHDDLAGIQIEIIGYSDKKAAAGREEWILENFTDEEVQYLADLIIGISNATGIPTTSSVTWGDDTNPKRLSVEEFKNYQGILGHRHAPHNDHWDPVGIWDKLEKALNNASSSSNYDSCLGNLATTGDVRALQETVLKYAWPEFRGVGAVEKKPEYEEAVRRAEQQGQYVGDSCYGGGVDCGGFVHRVMIDSGWDTENFGDDCNTTCLLSKLSSSSQWSDITSTIHSNSDALPGDIILKSGHVLLYVGQIPNFGSEMASASQCERAPMADSAPDITNYIDKGFQIFRRN